MSDTKILIVEEEQHLTLDLHEKLERLGFIITGTADTEERALLKAGETPPDLVLVDIAIEGDIDRIKNVKQMWQRFNIPVIFLTASTDEETIERAKLPGPFACLIKPFNERELKLSINAAIDKHHLEKKLNEREETFRAVFNLSSEAIVLLDTKGVMLDINERLSHWLGYKPEAIIGKNLLDLTNLSGKNKDILMEKFSRRIRGMDVPPYELDFITDKGEERVGRIRGTLISDKDGNVIQDLAMISDITEHKRVEEALRESEEKYKGVFENTGTAIGIFGDDSVIIMCNNTFEKLSGYKKNEIEGRLHWYDFVSGKDRVRMEKYHKQRSEGTGKPPEEYESGFINRDGHLKYVHVKIGMIPGTKNRIASLFDITQRKQAEEAVRESEERYRTLQVNIPVGVFRSTPEGKMISVNPAMVRMFGCDSEEELLALPAVDLYRVPQQREELLNLLVEKGEATHFEVQMKRKDRSNFWASLNIKALFDEQGKVIHQDGILEDITERKKIEEELLKAEKLESVGLLAGGIAHDFNNILAAVLVNVGLARLYIKKEDKVLEKLSETEKAILRAKDLTQQLLTFSKGGAPITSPASIDRLLTDTADFALSGSNVRCDCMVPDDLWDVEIDEGQVSQVIQNLIINAVQAMPEGGVIRIGAENISIAAGKGPPLKEGKYIRITIRDQGIGIPNGHLGKVFDPFFTTKQRGSGLGLSTAYSIIKNHNGLITVDSALGQGATFSIYLPAAVRKEGEKKKSKPKVMEGQGKILLMDDEDIILEAISELLREIGYIVKTAKNGGEAIKIYEKARQANQPFDALILDLIVPGGLGGQETLRELLKIDPDVKAVASSGYSINPIMANYKEYGFSGAITKPFKIKELTTLLRNVITGSDK
jgi:PAS domain S-box-containing protein